MLPRDLLVRGGARQTRQHKLLCPHTVWSIQVNCRNQEGRWNGTPLHTFYPEEYPQLFVRSDGSIYQIHFYDISYVELEEAKDDQQPPSQINSAPRIGSANEDNDYYSAL